MSLDNLLRLLSTANFPIAIGMFGLLLNVGATNPLVKNAGTAVALMAAGAAAATIIQKDEALADVRQLQTSHRRREAALKTSINMALADVVKAQQWARQQTSIAEQASRNLLQLQHQIAGLKVSRDRAIAAAAATTAQLAQLHRDLPTYHSDNSLIVSQLERLERDRTQLIDELYQTTVTEADLSTSIVELQTQFKQDLTYQLTQKKKLKAEVTQARANFHTEITDAYERIGELETALTAKTELATQMLTELEKDATDTFAHFSGKVNAQDKIISTLRQQIKALEKTDTPPTYKRFDSIGADNIMGNRLIDYLAKNNMIYSAFIHQRKGHSGHLKVTLDMVETTLKQARDSLADMEAALDLWAQPSVTIHGGRHVFTLATDLT
ncbi:MAG: hypothetical protein WA885_04470 [Phormidesmis sp.]